MPLKFHLLVMNILADVLVALIVKLIDELTIKKSILKVTIISLRNVKRFGDRIPNGV
jgi:hypothetical protein